MVKYIGNIMTKIADKSKAELRKIAIILLIQSLIIYTLSEFIIVLYRNHHWLISSIEVLINIYTGACFIFVLYLWCIVSIKFPKEQYIKR